MKWQVQRETQCAMRRPCRSERSRGPVATKSWSCVE